MNKKGLIAVAVGGTIALSGVGFGGYVIGTNNPKNNVSEDNKTLILEASEDITARLGKSVKEVVKEITGFELVDEKEWNASATIEKKGGKEYQYIISGTAEDKKYCDDVNASLEAYTKKETDEKLLDYVKKVLILVKNSEDIKAEQVKEHIEAVDVSVGTIAKTMIGQYNTNQDFKKVDEVTNIVADKKVEKDALNQKNTVIGALRVDPDSAEETIFDTFVASTFDKKVFTINYSIKIAGNASASVIKEIMEKYLNEGIVDEGISVEYKDSIVEDLSLTPSIFQKVNSLANEKEDTVDAGV